MREIARRQEDGGPSDQTPMQPGAEIEEAGQRPSADTQKHAAFVCHRPGQRIERNHDTMIELALLGPGQGVAGSLSVEDESGNERGTDDRINPNMLRPESAKITDDAPGSA